MCLSWVCSENQHHEVSIEISNFKFIYMAGDKLWQQHMNIQTMRWTLFHLVLLIKNILQKHMSSRVQKPSSISWVKAQCRGLTVHTLIWIKFILIKLWNVRIWRHLSNHALWKLWVCQKTDQMNKLSILTISKLFITYLLHMELSCKC